MYKPVQHALSEVGDKHLYQIILIIFLFFISAQVNYMLMGPTFIFMNPLFNCTFSNQLVDESQACGRLSECQVSNSFTLVSKLELYCDKQAERNVIQTIVPIGAIVGLIIINSISDSYGRKIGIVLSQLAGIIGVGLTFIGGLYQQYWIVVIAQFLCGFCGYSLLMMAYFTLSEFCEDQFRQKSLITINYAWAATFVVFGLLFYYYNSWQTYLLYVVLCPMIGFLIFSLLFLVEGPNFLYGKKKRKECLQSFKTIARFNRRMRNFEQIAVNFKLQFQLKQQQIPSLLSVLKNLQYLRMIIILILIEGGANLYYNGTNYAINQIGFDYGANMISSGAIQLAAFIILSFYITKIPRKKGLIILYVITIVLGLLFFIEEFQNNKVIAFIIIGILRFFSTITYAIGVMLLTETFPLNVQVTCAGIIESIAQLGSFLGPIVITFCINLQIYPIIVLSFIVAVAVLIPLLFLKMPKNREGTVKESLINNDSTTILSNRQQE